MIERRVVDSSPLIFLARAGILDLLRIEDAQVAIPRAVAAELEQRGSNDRTVAAIRQAAWLNVVEDPRIPPSIQSWGLGAGESAVLAWALQTPPTEAVLDDLLARRCATVHGIPVRGTLGLILRAKQRGVIPAARPVLENLRHTGMYLSQEVLDEALRLVGE